MPDGTQESVHIRFLGRLQPVLELNLQSRVGANIKPRQKFMHTCSLLDLLVSLKNVSI